MARLPFALVLISAPIQLLAFFIMQPKMLRKRNLRQSKYGLIFEFFP